MATTLRMQISNGKGLCKVILFEGLQHRTTIHPMIHKNPILTVQGFYYLEDLDAVSSVQFESREKVQTDHEYEYMIDNYLFSYALSNPSSKLTSKINTYKFQATDFDDNYTFYDNGRTAALSLDLANDDTVLSIEDPIDPTVDFSDWCLIKNYSEEYFHDYLKSMGALLNKKLEVFVMPSDHHNGVMGKERIVRCDGEIIDAYQAERLDLLGPRDIKSSDESVTLRSSIGVTRDIEIPVEHYVCTTQYSRVMLSYYFSGAREFNPLPAFVGFYNVLEHYFEEAPIILGVKAVTERQQIEAVVRLVVSASEVKGEISLHDSDGRIFSEVATSTVASIKGLKILVDDDYLCDLARYLYEIRCAIVHSKKTRRGAVTSYFEPYTAEADNIKVAIPILRWLAQKMILKDQLLNSV
ncbi:hypothetical protein [Pseudomonas chlororaphis]|uniref:hypothetical protein n=1 Tax=Pseudomonas chlororaphis TaxID=587753 RepID=UPI00406C065A